MELVSTQVLDLDILQDVTTAVTGSLVGALVDLFKTDIEPVRTSVLGDFTLANYTGYAAKAVTWLAPSITDDGEIELVGTVPEFRPGDAVVPNDIYGLTVKDAGGNLLLAAKFDDAPLPMNSALDAIVVTLRFRLTSGGLVVVVS